MYALELLYRTKCGGFVHFAPPCSSFVWVSRNSTKRSRANPVGDESIVGVRMANLIVARVIVLCLLAMKRGIHFMLEQPASSLMRKMPVFQKVARHFNIFEFFTWMGMFGSPTPKPTKLWSGSEWLCEVTRKLERSMFKHIEPNTKTYTRYTDSNGKIRTKGTKSMKASQQYPDGYGKELARLYTEIGHKHGVTKPWTDISDDPVWHSAKLSIVEDAFTVISDDDE